MNKINLIISVVKSVAWTIGIYFAMYAVSFQRHQDKISEIEIRKQYILSRIDSNKRSLKWLFEIQNEKVPIKPNYRKPLSVVKSFLGYTELVSMNQEIVVRTIEEMGDDLSKLNLRGVDLSGAIIPGRNMDSANLELANLSCGYHPKISAVHTNFAGAVMKGSLFAECNFTNAYFGVNHKTRTSSKLQGIVFEKCKLTDATFLGANLKNSKFNFSDLSGTDFQYASLDSAIIMNCDAIKSNLTIEQVCQTNFVYGTKFNKQLMEKIIEKCPEKLKFDMDKIPEGLYDTLCGNERNLNNRLSEIYKNILEKSENQK